jgi:hypothetical protein
MFATVKFPALATTVRSAVIDVLALTFIFLMPVISHLVPFPLYYIEPMRIMVILAMMHSHRNNAYILAFVLPLFAFAISTHPVFIKSLMIAIELVAMVGLFHVIRKYVPAVAAIFSAIVLSKVLYYALKFGAVMTLMPAEKLTGVPFGAQLVVTLALSLYVMFVFGKQK